LNKLSVEDIINKEYFKPEKIAELRQQFKEAKPFPRAFLQNIMDPDFLKKVRAVSVLLLALFHVTIFLSFLCR
jgi:hypothetical protein